MSTRLPVRVVLDVGRTNKKILVFDEAWNALREQQFSIPETEHQGQATFNAKALIDWMNDAVSDACREPGWDVKGINFSGYGATLVHLDEKSQLVIPPEDYLDPYPENLVAEFESVHGSRETIALETASPWLGNLNSGLQLFRLKRTAPELFSRIAISMHLPQWLSWQFTKVAVSDMTSVGCHTMLWDFKARTYHPWVVREGFDRLLAPMGGGIQKLMLHGAERWVGTGLHDSSAAMIPYLVSRVEPFILVSTGTWSISLNPFNEEPLTTDELEKDCLCYLTRDGRQVKASRYFIGPDHEHWMKIIAEKFGCTVSACTSMPYDLSVEQRVKTGDDPIIWETLVEAYHAAMYCIIKRQCESILLAAGHRKPEIILVDGGFARNAVYMGMLAHAFPKSCVEAAVMPQASALGAAMVLTGEAF